MQGNALDETSGATRDGVAEMTREDEKLQRLILRYIKKNGGKKGSLWTLARQCYSVGYQARKRKEGRKC